MLGTIFINGPKIPCDCEPLKWFDIWNDMLMDAATHEHDLTEKATSENSFNEKDPKGKDFKEKKKFRSAFHIAIMIGHE